jgi:hypothetical protein
MEPSLYAYLEGSGRCNKNETSGATMNETISLPKVNKPSFDAALEVLYGVSWLMIDTARGFDLSQLNLTITITSSLMYAPTL